MTFLLRISGAYPEYHVQAESPTGEKARGELQLSRSIEELKRQVEEIADPLPRRRHDTGQLEQSARRLGDELFASLPLEVRELLRDSIPIAGPQQVRVALQVEPPELGGLPWELLRLPDRNEFPFRHHHLVRRLPVTHDEQPLRVQLPLRIVAMVGADPDRYGQDPRAELENAVGELVRNGQISLHWAPGRKWSDLVRTLETYSDPHVFHFIGHGGAGEAGGPSWIMIEDESGKPAQLPSETVANTLREHGSTQLVVINACETGRVGADDPYSSVAAGLIRRGTPTVVAMQFPITDGAAREFGQSFYRAIVHQSSVEAAVTRGRKAIEAVAGIEWATPVLYMHSSGGPIFELWQPEEVRRYPVGRDINAVAFGPGNDRLALACDGRQSRVLFIDGWTSAPLRGGLNASLYTVAFRPNAEAGPATGAQLATGGLDGAARIWDGRSHKQIARLPHPTWVSDVAYAADGGRLATACGDGVVRLWDIGADGRPVPDSRRMLPPHGSTVRSVAFHPDGRSVATACDDGLVRTWDVDQGTEPLRTLGHGPGAVFGVAYSPDGARLATAGENGSAQIWDAREGTKPLRTLPHDGWVLAVAFTPDSRLLATASHDRTARVWEVATGRQLFVTRHRDTVRRVAISPDGLLLATASYDNTCQIWLLPAATAELEVDDRFNDEEASELKASLRGFGIAVSRVQRVQPVRGLPDLPWLLLLLPLQAFFTALGAKLGSDAYDRLVKVLQRMMRRHDSPDRASDERRGGLLVREDETEREILLEPCLPKAAYDALFRFDLTGFKKGRLRYDRDRGKWVVT